MADYISVTQPFEPVFNAESRILILGSFPSVASRENQFYYGHSRNRFWKVIAAVFDEEVPQSIEQKKALLLRHHLALYDSIESCRIQGSSDASIRDAVPADLSRILDHAPVEAIICNGKASLAVYKKYQESRTHLSAVSLPSTSPANAAFSLERLISLWKPAILDLLQTHSKN